MRDHRPTDSRNEPRQALSTLCNFAIRQYNTVNIVSAGIVTESDAIAWFSTFFDGCDRFVPVFDSNDSYDAIRMRSSILFDIVVIYGARAAGAPYLYQNLYGVLRQHTSDLVLRLTASESNDVSLEDLQAILILASYSASGAILLDVAIRAAVRAGLPTNLDSLDSASVDMQQSVGDLKAARIWCYLFVLDVILSLDGGKPSSLILQSPRRVKSLLNHPQRTALDIRLFAQVELNAIRSSSYTSLLDASAVPHSEHVVKGIVRGTSLDLNVWLSEWRSAVFSESSTGSERDTLNLNLQVQHAWALLTLHLRALMTLGIDNIALMSETQRNIAKAAKEEAEYHLQLVLTHTGNGLETSHATVHKRPYIDNFPYAMEFVWAKNAFCVLIALRLGILLADPLDQIRTRLSEANDFLRELDRVGVGANISYTRILTKTVQKCETTIQASLERPSLQEPTNPSDSDFESFVPKEFVFEWDFPGLHLCYVPLDWRDFFLDIETAGCSSLLYNG